MFYLPCMGPCRVYKNSTWSYIYIDFKPISGCRRNNKTIAGSVPYPRDCYLIDDNRSKTFCILSRNVDDISRSTYELIKTHSNMHVISNIYYIKINHHIKKLLTIIPRTRMGSESKVHEAETETTEPRVGKTEEDWNGLKLGFLKTVQPNSFSKLIPAACNFKNNAQKTFVCLGSVILSFTCYFIA